MNFQRLLMQSLLWRGFYFFTLLMVNVFLSRYLQAAGSGWVYYLSNIFSFSIIIVGICLEAGITYFASGKIIHSNRLLWFSLVASAAVSLIVLGGIYVYLLFEQDTTVPPAQFYYFGICYITGLFLTNCVTALFYAQNNFVLPNLILTVLNIALVIFIPKGVIANDLTQAGILLDIYFLFFLLQGVFLWLAYFFKNKSWMTISIPNSKHLGSLFRYSLVAMIANVIFFLVYRIDYLFVHSSPVCTEADLGNYIQVSKLGQMLLIVPQIIASVIFPRTASGIERKELNNSIMIIARLFSQLYLFIFLVILFFGTQFFTGLFGHTFDRMKLPFLILIPGIFSLSVLSLLSAYFSGKDKLRVNLTGALLALIFVIAGDYLFVPTYGILAAAAVSTIGYTINVGYALFIFYKDYSINLVDFFGWRRSDYAWLKTLLVTKP